ncbi:MAG: hydrogenase nickel incorporation protein HypB [Gemmatimonadaceae bacterium]|nr:hydrogenase nickel incorporation protein HypB [Gemmatimonadaceae bacterium]MCU0625786.1 hydrogenase nickel incorporation protein HypB [Gemmatimonadaceae bacterium]
MPQPTSPVPGTVQCADVSLQLLKANDWAARTVRDTMAAHGVMLINLTSSAGSGKTLLLEKTVVALKGLCRMLVLEGDLETERDADRIRRHGVPAIQITTGTTCHLEAPMILQALERVDLADVDLVIIENVGNLVCPAAYDLGESLRVTLLAVTEGDDKPRKYPRMFLSTDLVVLSKSDLLPHVPFSVEAAIADCRAVRADLEVQVLSAHSGEGMDRWLDWLRDRMAALWTGDRPGAGARLPDGAGLGAAAAHETPAR